jgi:hypothetical protein
MIKEPSIFKKLSRYSRRIEMLQILEKGWLKNAEPLTTPAEDWSKLKHLLIGDLDFNSGTSSSEGWETFTAGGLRDETKEISFGESSIALISIIKTLDWTNNTLTHQMAISYRTSKGTFYTYIGNITDFYNQIVKIVETAHNSEKFGL